MAKLIVNYQPGVVKKIAAEFGMSDRNIRRIFRGEYNNTENYAVKALHDKIIRTACQPPYNCSVQYI